MLKVLLVTAPGPVGGLESVVAALASGLKARNHRVLVSAATDHGRPQPFLETLVAAGVETRTPPAGYWGEARALRGIIQEGGFEVVHSHGYRSDALAWLASRGLGRALVSTVHGFTGGGAKNRAYERIQRRVLRGFDAVVAVSRPLEAQLGESGVRSDRIRLLPNAFTPVGALPRAAARARLGIPQDAFAVGWVGRLSREKGADVAIDAMSRLEEPEWLAVFVGDGPERARLEEQAARSAVADRVRWLGALPAAGTLMAAFDVVLLSSRTEGTPIVALEAMAAGVPLVATAVGGVPDLLAGDRGWLVPPEDPAAIAQVLRSVRGDQSTAARRAGISRQRMQTERTSDSWLDAHEALYRSLLNS